MMTSRVNSTTLSLAIHTGALAILLLLSKAVRQPVSSIQLLKTEPLLAPIKLRLQDKGSSGAGGQRMTEPATAGRPPARVYNVFVPPTLEVLNSNPKLAVAMGIEAPPEANEFHTLGDPLAQLVNGSSGKGGPLGIGNGPGTGIGNKRGPGVGNGDMDTGTVYRAGQGITMPVLIHQVEPEFSDEARKAKYSGIVKIRVDVDVTGRARNLRVINSLGMGLDEKAIAAVTQWRFRPGTKDGKPVPVMAVIEVSFHLL